MTLPSSGSISIAQIATELGLSLPLSLDDSRVRALAGKPSGSLTMPNDFWGKSLASIDISGYFNQQTTGGGGSFQQVYDRGSFSISRSPTTLPAPTSYVWSMNDYGGQLMPGNATGAVFTVSGPAYDQFAFNVTYDVVIGCTAVIGGTSYYTQRTFSYTAPL